MSIYPHIFATSLLFQHHILSLTSCLYIDTGIKFIYSVNCDSGAETGKHFQLCETLCMKSFLTRNICCSVVLFHHCAMTVQLISLHDRDKPADRTGHDSKSRAQQVLSPEQSTSLTLCFQCFSGNFPSDYNIHFLDIPHTCNRMKMF